MKSYLTFLSRHKVYTSIQALGLIISIAFIILITNYVWQQYSLAYSNKYHAKVYVVGSNVGPSLSSYEKAELEHKLPGLQAISRYDVMGYWLNIGDEVIESSAIEVDKDFFDIFPEFELIVGSQDQLINEETCVVSEEFANQYYGGKDPIGEVIYDNVKITGIYRLNGQTMVNEADVIMILPENPEPEIKPFSNLGRFITLIKVSDNINPTRLLDEITKIEREHYNEGFIKEFVLFPLPELYFEGFYQFKSGDKTQLKILLAVVILLLISSTFNYINLSLAQSSQRSKERATRMLLGDSQTGVVMKSIMESLFFVFVCGGIGVGLAYIFRPIVDQILMNIAIQVGDYTWRYEHIKILWNISTVLIFLGFLLLLGILAGIIPSIYAARNKPIDIIRGNLKVKTRMIFGKIFIVFQNIVTVILIALSIVMEAQMNHMYHRPLHARMDNVFLIYFNFNDYESASPLIESINKISGVKRVGFGSSYPGRISMFGGVRPVDSDEQIPVGLLKGNKDFFDIMNLEIIEDSNRTNSSGLLFVSESLANAIQLNESNINRYLSYFNLNQTKATDFGGIYRDIPRKGASINDDSFMTAFILADNSKLYNNTTILIEVNNETKELEDAIKKAYYDYVKERFGVEWEPFEMGYVSQLHKNTLVPIKSTIVLLEIFMGLSLLISLLGLIAMSTFFANENTRGIAIRKVMGSNIKKEIIRNVRMYMILVIIAIIFAIPLSVVIANEYLSRFSYRIENYWWIFFVAAVSTLIVAFLAVIWQTTKAAHTNPATELKKE